MKQWNENSLGSAGAVEALFAAVARRLRGGAPPVDAATLEELWHLQSRLIQRRDGWAPEPLTRPPLQGRAESGPEWLACCWTWSFRVERPRLPLRDEDAWLLPGWIRPHLSTAPRWLESLYLRRELIGEQIEQWDWLLGMVESVVSSCDDVELPPSVAEVLFPGILRAAPQKGWRITGEIARYMLYNGLTPSLALASVGTLPESAQVTVARSLWHALVMDKAADQSIWNLSRATPVFDFISQRLTEEDVRNAVRKGKIGFPFLDPGSDSDAGRLPLPLWEAGLHELLIVGQSKESNSHDADKWPRWTGAILEALIGKQPNTPDWLGIRNLWSVDPDRALQRTVGAYPDDPAAMYWVSEGWSRGRDAIIRMMEQNPLRPLPEWARQWLARNLADTPGQEADRIFALLAVPKPAGDHGR